MKARYPLFVAVLAAGLALGPRAASGGPPFVIDDPEPVDRGHLEVCAASQVVSDAGGRSGTAPQVELNFGAAAGLQLHVLAPMAFDAPASGAGHYGYGDTELGAKYRLLGETGSRPQLALYPAVQLPSGDAGRDLGGGRVTVFLPVWLQKSWGGKERAWTLYGGGGYDIHRGEGNQDWTLFGAVLQRRVRKHVLVGGELFHQAAGEAGGRAGTDFNFGTAVDVSGRHHVLASAGGSVQGPARSHAYVAWQLTTGPRR